MKKREKKRSYIPGMWSSGCKGESDEKGKLEDKKRQHFLILGSS